MSSKPPLRNPAGGSDHEHVDRISTPTTLFMLVLIAALIYAIRAIILPFAIAALLAYVCTPAIEWMRGRTGLPRALFAVAAFLLFVAFAAAVVFLAAGPVGREVMRMATDLQSVLEAAIRSAVGDGEITLLGHPTDAHRLAQDAVAALRQIVERPKTLAIIGGTAFLGVFGLSLTLVLLFYFLLGGPQILRGVLWLVPPKQRPLIERIAVQVDPVLKRYFIGVIADVIYATIAAYIGLGIVLGIRHAVLLALLTGLLEMIPMLGPAAAIALAGLVAVHYATGIKPIIDYAIYATVLRLSIDQVVGPLALGTAAQMSPVLILFCFLTGGLTFGVTGVLLAVPIALLIKVTLATLYDERSL
jgi:predicted PurR-regulated permease PerM